MIPNKISEIKRPKDSNEGSKREKERSKDLGNERGSRERGTRPRPRPSERLMYLIKTITPKSVKTVATDTKAMGAHANDPRLSHLTPTVPWFIPPLQTWLRVPRPSWPLALCQIISFISPIYKMATQRSSAPCVSVLCLQSPSQPDLRHPLFRPQRPPFDLLCPPFSLFISYILNLIRPWPIGHSALSLP